jgi:flavodoxin
MKKALVAYFSATGMTKRIAEMLAKSISAKTFEIVPKRFYTKEDLDWTNENSRSTIEMKNKNCRPEIESRVQDLAQYDVVFLGFPVWWYREPSIIDTFVESHDLNGKLIVPFATSGGSPIGDSYRGIQALAQKAKVEKGKVFDAGVSMDELKKWAERYLEK